MATVRTRWDLATEWILIGLLFFSPLAFGAVEAWSELVVVVAGAALSICLAARVMCDRTFHPAWSVCFVPPALFVLLIGLQCTSLPLSVVERLSPVTVATKVALLGGQDMHSTSLTYYPLATLHDLRLVLVGTAIFVATVFTFQSPDQIRRVLASVFLVGVTVAVLALLQIGTFATQIYWSVGVEQSGVVTSGPFVNHSNFSQFMNLSVGAGLALLLVRFREAEKRGHFAFWRRRGEGSADTWIMIGLILCAVSVFTSLSRNGALAFTIAATFIGTALYWRKILSWRGWLLAVLPWGALGVLLLVGFDAVYERLATLQSEHDWSFRREMTAGTLRAWWEHAVWGTGLGTHEYVFPMFDRAAETSIAAHADNDYAQLLEETGLIGAGLVAVFLVLVATHWVFLAMRGRSSLAVASFGLAFGLSAVAIQSASDFGQHLPANFCLSAIACGLIVSMSQWEKRRGQANRDKLVDPCTFRSPVHRRWIAGVGALLVAMVWSWCLYGAYAAYRGETHWHQAMAMEAYLSREGWQGSDEEYVDLLMSAMAANESEPNNVKYGYWLNLYRWYSISRTVDESTGEILLHPDSVPIVNRIANEFAGVRAICPTFGPPYAMEGQLRWFVLGEAAGEKLIQQGYELANYDPPTCLVAGKLAAQRGDVREAVTILHRAVALRPSSFREVMRSFLFEFDRPDLAIDLAGNDHARLTELAKMCATSERFAELEASIRLRTERLLRQRAASKNASVSELRTLAAIEVEKGDLDSAISLYRRALQTEYGNVSLRLNLARLLSQQGENEEALRQARICLRVSPGNERAKQLIEDLSVY